MQILRSLKNNSPSRDEALFSFPGLTGEFIPICLDSPVKPGNDMNVMARRNEKGFTLLECILAVGILSIVLASLVGLQSSIVFVAQNSTDKLKAVWAMRQASSQLDYILNAGGLSAIAEKSQFIWPGDKRFNVTITKKDLNDVKPSQFLVTALNFDNLSSNKKTNIQQMLAPIIPLLDNTPLSATAGTYENTAIKSTIGQSNFVNIFINVDWLSGTNKGTFNAGSFLMDNNALANLKLPSFSSTGAN